MKFALIAALIASASAIRLAKDGFDAEGNVIIPKEDDPFVEVPA